jgi:hypothetical protein
MAEQDGQAEGVPGEVRRALLFTAVPARERALVDALADAGWGVDVFSDTAALLAAAENEPPEIALVTAGDGGAAMVRDLRHRCPRIPLVVLAAPGANADDPALREASPDAVFWMPLDTSALAALCAGLVADKLRRLPPAAVVAAPQVDELPEVRPGKDRRREERFDLDHARPVRVHRDKTGKFFWSIIRNLTSRGLGFVCGELDLEPGERVQLEHVSTTRRQRERTPGVVRWLHRDRPTLEVGLELSDPDGRAARHLVYDLLLHD